MRPVAPTTATRIALCSSALSNRGSAPLPALIEEVDAITLATDMAPLKYATLMLTAWQGNEDGLAVIEAMATAVTARARGWGWASTSGRRPCCATATAATPRRSRPPSERPAWSTRPAPVSWYGELRRGRRATPASSFGRHDRSQHRGQGVRRAAGRAAGHGETVPRGSTAEPREIARLAREGCRPHIGARPFLSPRTVEWHLRKVYTKLEIRSRHELSNALPRSESELAPA